MHKRGSVLVIALIAVAVVIIAVGIWYWNSMSSSPSLQQQSNGSGQQDITNNNLQTNPMSNNLKSQLEVAYGKVRAVIVAKGNLTAWGTVFEENNDPSLPPITPTQWPGVLENIIAPSYPDLSGLHYISSEQDGKYAHYFAWADAPDKPQEYMNVWDYVFHDTSSGWILTGFTLSDYLRKGPTDVDNEKIAQADVVNLKDMVTQNLKQ